MRFSVSEPYRNTDEDDMTPQLNFGKTRVNGTQQVGTLADGRRVDGSFFGQSSFGRHALVKATSVSWLAGRLVARCRS